MNPEELANRLEERLVRIEEKLDEHIKMASVNQNDLSWVKGYIKTSLSAIVALIGGMITVVFNMFFK